MTLYIKRAIIAFVVLFSFCLGALGTLLFTPFGLQFVLWGGNYVLPQLSVEDSEGSLLTGFNLKGISYRSPAFSLTGKTISLELDAACLSQFSICVNALGLEGLDILVPKNDPSNDTETAPLFRIESPVALYIKAISLTDISLDIMGNKVDWDSFTSGLELKGSQLTLKPTLWQGMSLTLPSTQAQNLPKVAKTQTGKTENKTLTLPEITIPLDVIIERLELKDVQLQLPEKQVIHQLVLQANASGNKVEIETFVLDAQQGKVTAKGNITLEGEYPLTLSADAKINMPPLVDQTVSLNAKGALNALDLDVKVDGKLQASLVGKVNVLESTFPFDFLLSSPYLQWPIDSKAQVSLASSALRATGSLDAYTANLKTAISSEGIPDVVLDTKLSGDLSQIALNDINIETLGGLIQGSASANWRKEVTWKSQLNFKQIQPERQWPEAKGILSGELSSYGSVNQQGGWSVKLPSVNVQGEILNQSLSLLGDMSVSDLKGNSDLRIETKGLSLQHGPNNIVLKGMFDKQLELDLLVDVPRLAASLPEAKGYIKGKVTVLGTLDAPIATINLNAKGLDWQQTVSVEKMNVRGSLRSTPLISGGLVVTLSDIKAPGADISSLSLRLSGDEREHKLSLTLDGEPVSGSINVQGRVTPQQNWEGFLFESNINTPIGPWVLEDKVALTFNRKAKRGTMGAFCWAQAPARLCLDKPISLSGSGQAQLSLSQFSLPLLHPLLPTTTSLSGLLNAKAKVAWKPNAIPSINAKMSVTKGHVIPDKGQPLTVGWDEILLNATLANDILNGNLKIQLTDNGSVSLNTEMKRLSVPERQIKNKLIISDINLDMLEPLVGVDAKINGLLNANVSFDSVIKNGEVDVPNANGSLVLSELKLQSLAMPVEIKQGKITLLLEGYNGKINGEIKTPDGELTVSGKAKWPKRNAWQALLNVKGERLKVVVPPMVALEVSPNMTLTATPDEVSVTGNVVVPWGRILVESLPVSAVQVSSDIVILNDKLEPIEKRKIDSLRFNSQIGVKIGDDVELDAFGLKTALKGTLHVASDKYGPTVTGDINLEKGTYRSFGQDLLIKKGQIIFNGPADQPYFQIEAIRNPDAIEDGVEAGIRVSGSVDAPEVQVFSTPTMPQANALSYLTRGRNLDSNSDGNMMTSMLIGLGLSQSGKLVGQLGEAFGVQNLSLDTSGTGNDEKVEVSGYILPGLQVKYGVGIFTRLPEFSVRYRLLQSFYIEAVSGADEAVDLLYQFSIK